VRRRDAIDQARRRLLRDGWPRLQMLMLVSLTGGAGFLAAWALLRAGVDTMAVRYPLAVALAYAVFLALLWLWLRTQSSDWAELVDLPGNSGHRGGDGPDWSAEGGHSGGAGASGAWDAGEADAVADGALDLVGKPVGEAVGLAAEADELAIPLTVLIVVGSVVVILSLSALLLVWSAPILFAELLVDGALAAGLYRRLRRLDARHWLETAVRRTWLPFLLTAVFASLAGMALSAYAPGATTLGDVHAHQAD
jgi:hypothetical protein